MIYEPPKDEERIDAIMLTKVLYLLETQIPYDIEHLDIILIGGSALTILTLKPSGSLDIDLITLQKTDIKKLVKNLNLRKYPIIIKEKQIPLPKGIHLEQWSKDLPSTELPKDYTDHLHRIKKVPWVIPKTGETRMVPTTDLFQKIRLYTLGLHDLLITKIYSARKKDHEDIKRIMKEIPLSMRFFSLRKEKLLERFIKFLETNTNKRNEKAINYYEWLIKNTNLKLKPLPEEVKKKYLGKKP